ncbi:hypothetical protein D1BOALGB6SA_3047 [Olavius sp. associated proteobacterium Delta 1]|nr:hypothetical protein D1BOALGB6SA_3047 [Olavius sp. associated proteobacterium Delta 1]
MINKFLGYTAITIVFALYYLYIFETLSKIRERRIIYLRDWGFGLPFKNLFEYRQICEQENYPLIWYKAQLYLIYAFLGTIILFVITSFF